MTELAEIDMKQIVLSDGPFGPKEIRRIQQAIAEDFEQYRSLREAVSEFETSEGRSPAAAVKLGVCYYLLGRYQLSLNTLKTGDGGALAHYYMGKCNAALGRHEAAIASYVSAVKAGYNADDCALAKADSQRQSGDARGALATLDALSGAVESSAEYLYQRGATVAAIGGNPREVVALYERAVDADPNHPALCLGWAWKTIVAATTKSHSICTSGRSPSFRRASAIC